MSRLPFALLFTLLALASPASAAIGGYDATDGVRDLTGVVQSDPTGVTDDVLSGKELEPNQWDVVPGPATGKADFTSFGFHVTETEQDAFLYLHFDLLADTGNVAAGFELHQSRATYTTTFGDAVPCRTDGDVLIAYDGNEDPVALDVYRWEGEGGPASCPDGAGGQWTGPDASAVAEGVLAGTFGEAAVNLRGLADLVSIGTPCEYFTALSAHSRNSGSTLNSQLGDIVASLSLSVASCSDGDDSVPVPTVPTLAADAGCHADGTVTLSGAGAAGSQVQVREGTTTVGVADVAGDGSWSLVLSDVPDGAHTYSARARNTDASVTPPRFSEPSADSAEVTVGVDTTPPSLTLETATGGAGQVAFAGTSDPGATVTVLEGDVEIASATAAADGAWSATAGVPEGEHTYVVRASDACGNTAAAGDADGDGQDGVTVVVTPAGPDETPGGDTPGGDTPGGGTPGGGTAGTGGAGTPGTDPDSGGDVAGNCATKPFRVLISKNEKRVKRVTFLVDGRKVKTVRKRDRRGRFTTMIDPAKYKPGTHQVTAKLKLRNGKTRKVRHRVFQVCGVGKCTSRMKFWMPIRRVSGDPYVAAEATVAGRKAKVTRRKGRLGVRVNLIGKPKGAYKVRVLAVTESGRAVKRVRKIRTCGLEKKSKS